MASLIGLFRIGRDSEVRFTQAGKEVASLALAYNYGMKGQDGKQPTQWIEAAIWGERAGKIAPHLTKGKQVYASIDDIHVETYQKSDGTSGTKLTGRVGNIEFASSPQLAGDAPRAPAPRPAPRPAPAPSGGSTGFADMDDDIPF